MIFYDHKLQEKPFCCPCALVGLHVHVFQYFISNFAHSNNKYKSDLFVQTVSKGVCYFGSTLFLRRAIHKYAICLQSCVNGPL